MEKIPLAQWKVMASLPYQADFSSYITEGLLVDRPTNLVPWIDATVPGSIYRDLQREGFISDPYFDRDSLHCEWVAGRWWTYRTAFTVTAEQLKKTVRLRFGGIDYAAQIYVNGRKVGRHEGMYIPFEAVINDFLKPDAENTLVCVLEHAPMADPQPGYTSKTRYLKARFNYKWDFAARVMDLGLYEPVTVTVYDAATILHSFARPLRKDGKWRLDCQLEVMAYRETDAAVSLALELATAEGTRPLTLEEQIHLREGTNVLALQLPLGDAEPLLWWPNGYGEQVLSPLTLSLGVDGTEDDRVTHQVGFRTLGFIHAEGREDALRYSVVINGKRIYLKGTNMVPLDCIHCVDQAVIDRRLRDVAEANVNFLRIWGGGHLESEAFYRCADKYGLMVLQEFTMSSSGCDDVPSRDPEFLKLLHTAAIHNTKRLRNHVSLTFMDGGNELTDWRYLGRADHEGHPATFEDPTLAMLRGIVESLAPDIQMLPSSASGPNALLKIGDIGNNHDVHGPWGYMGPYDHYSYYDSSDSIIHGEFGCGGICGMDQIQRIFRPEDRKLFTAAENRAWAHHSGGWDNYPHRERLMFGDLKALPLEDYVKVNQFVQAESLRYALESNRRRQWKNVGQMTWQFNEPWPNVQCSNVLEYYGGRKLAYYAVKEAYAPVLASLHYEKLFYTPGECFQAQIWLINDRRDADYTLRCTVLAEDGRELAAGRFHGHAQEDLSFQVSTVTARLPEDLSGSFTVRLETCCGGERSDKEYLMLMADLDIPLELTKADRDLRQIPRLRKLLEGKRASAASVIRFVDRWWEKLR